MFDQNSRLSLTPRLALTRRRLGTRLQRRLWLGLLAFGIAISAGATVPPELADVPEKAIASPWGIAAFLLAYMALLALPFVPGAELGLTLLIVFGAALALPVYLATVLGLSIAFLVGRLAPIGRSDQLKHQLEDLSGRHAQRGWLRCAMRFRWLALALLINMPGNSVLGGGGGIALAAGYGRVFTFPAFIACISIAVAPVPAAFLLADQIGLGTSLSKWLTSMTSSADLGAGNGAAGEWP